MKPSIAKVVRDSVAASTLSGDRVLLHLPSGTYLKLDRSAGTIFDLLAQYESVPRAAQELSSRFSISSERATIDVNMVVNTLSDLRPARSSDLRSLSAGGAIDIGRQWWSLPWRLRLAVVEATGLVVAVEIGMRITDVRRLAKLMRVPMECGAVDLPNEAADDMDLLSPGEQRAYWATRWVLQRWVYDGTCLRRALAAGFVLRRHHPVLRLGLTDDGHTTHAWVEASGSTYNASDVTSTFVVLGA